MLTRKLLITALLAAGTIGAAGMPLTSAADTRIEFGYGAPVQYGYDTAGRRAAATSGCPGIGGGTATGECGYPAIGSASTATRPGAGTTMVTAFRIATMRGRTIPTVTEAHPSVLGCRSHGVGRLWSVASRADSLLWRYSRSIANGGCDDRTAFRCGTVAGRLRLCLLRLPGDQVRCGRNPQRAGEPHPAHYARLGCAG